jgi:hypothetical protein
VTIGRYRLSCRGATVVGMNRTHTRRPRFLRPTTPVGHFVRHLVEMVVAMIVGMVVLEPVWPMLAGPLGWAGVLELPEPAALVMATNMTIAMSTWMRHRGHGWAATAEMAAAMYLPFVVLFVPMWWGAITPDGMLVGGHLLMLPAMVAAMLWRRGEYTGGQ